MDDLGGAPTLGNPRRVWKLGMSPPVWGHSNKEN